MTRSAKKRPAVEPAAVPSQRKTSIKAQVDPDVWAKAITLANGDSRRIEVLDKFDVVVKNHRVRSLSLGVTCLGVLEYWNYLAS